MAKARRTKEDRDLDIVIKKVMATKPPSTKQERRLTGKTRSRDVSAETNITVRLSKNPLAARIQNAVRKKQAREQEYVDRVTAVQKTPIRREIAMPQDLPVIMAPPLPKRKDGDKPNIVSLLYAMRAMQQFNHAFTRRNMGDPASREAHYVEMKKRFRKAMNDADLADFFDWRDF